MTRRSCELVHCNFRSFKCSTCLALLLFLFLKLKRCCNEAGGTSLEASRICSPTCKLAAYFFAGPFCCTRDALLVIGIDTEQSFSTALVLPISFVSRSRSLNLNINFESFIPDSSEEECSTTCGGGLTIRKRNVERNATHDGVDCRGNQTQSQACNAARWQ